MRSISRRGGQRVGQQACLLHHSVNHTLFLSEDLVDPVNPVKMNSLRSPRALFPLIRNGLSSLWLKRAPIRGAVRQHGNTRRRKPERQVYLGLRVQTPCVSFEPACFLRGLSVPPEGKLCKRLC
jgi:hypothetical protein